MPAWTYTLIPALATVLGAALAAWREPGPKTISAVQHFAAGVVFAAAAGEILPELLHRQSPMATIVGGSFGAVTMLAVKAVGRRATGPVGLIAVTSVDVLVDGLVLGIGFAAGVKQGVLLTIALTIEVLFLGLAVSPQLARVTGSKAGTIAATAGVAALLPVGALVGGPVGTLPADILTSFYGFGVVALLYLVTEELLIEAHEGPEDPWITAMFFAGFLLLLVFEECT